MDRVFTVPARLDGERLDKVLADLMPESSRRMMRSAIGRGAVYHNGKRCMKVSRTVRDGDRIELCGEDRVADFEGASCSLRIILNEEGIVAVDKPPLVPSTPTRSSTVSAQLFIADHFGLRMESVHPVNRLDLPVSGVLLFALGREAAARAEEAKRRLMLEKDYLAWVRGAPGDEEGIIEDKLSSQKGTAFVDDSGKESVTRYRKVRTAGNFSLLEVRPVTGRMHQIRVHLRSAGFPIVGDRKYGEPPYITGRPLLHCQRISFPSEMEGRSIKAEAPPPRDFEEFALAAAGYRQEIFGGTP